MPDGQRIRLQSGRRVQQHLAERELLKEPLADRVEVHDRRDVLGRRRCRAASQLHPGPARHVPKHGIAYVPQGRRLFGDLTVAENLRIGQMVRDTGPDTLHWVLALFPILVERMRQRSQDLSGGEQQMLAVARALCAEPTVLLMDEPTEGLMPSMIKKMIDTVAALRDRGVAVLLVEQKVEVALAVADRILFLDSGTIAEVASPDRLRADAGSLRRYLGVAARA
jgi:branched-chain amino acid transport system ATP-binding protein